MGTTVSVVFHWQAVTKRNPNLCNYRKNLKKIYTALHEKEYKPTL